MALFKKGEKNESETEAPAVPEHVEVPSGGRLDEMRASLDQAGLPGHAMAAALKEVERLEQTDPASTEYGIGLNYLDFVLALPWRKATQDNLDLERAQSILDQEHSGMRQVKERVLENLAVSIRMGSKPRRVLVVDDEVIARENMSHILSADGHAVDMAANGAEALSMLGAEIYDLVVTDLKMDHMDGMELLEKAKQVAPAANFVIITGYATVDTAVDAMRKGAVHFLAKPIDITSLRAIAQEVLGQVDAKRLAPSSVLCFSGPPGTGKTSIGRSIAHALGRSFIRLSMAGMRDESELRGHRRTYVGAMPGRILSELRRAEVRNPVFMLDELDKVGQDFRGDPAAILLEVLDPEQNRNFLDYYLDIPFDLSSIHFVATANVVERLPRPLLDRLEIIEFPSYTPSEKRSIGLEHLLPRQLSRHGLTADDLAMTPEAMDKVVSGYTREAGVRNLERNMAAICRKVNRRLLSEPREQAWTIDEKEVEELLGPPTVVREAARARDTVGIATAMVWTEFGGDILFVETAQMPGKGRLLMTGSLGDILKESAQTALSYIRSRAGTLGVDPDFFEKTDIHVHIPAGAVPKDGPSAGVTIAAAMVSLLTGRAARRGVALSGELTLSGRILPVGGLRDKILAAAQAGVQKAVFPERNLAQIEELEDEVRRTMELVAAQDLDQVLEHVLLPAGDDQSSPKP